MSKWAKWQDHEYAQLKLLIDEGLTNPQIAEIMGHSLMAIRIKAQINFGGNPNYRIQKTKHVHLREPVMRYFLTHSADETAKKFKLTGSEFKSLMTSAYRDPTFSHLRKETRNHAKWATKDFKFLFTHSGLMPRSWIAKKLKRGGELGIKDRLDKLGISSKSLNGLTLSQYRDAFACEPGFYLRTKAGPGQGKHARTYFKIIPWVWIDAEIKDKRLRAPKLMRKLVQSMALFQEWVYEGDALEKMKKICQDGCSEKLKRGM